MAINRFFQNTPVEAEGNFFKLPYQELATSIMAMETAYQTKQKEIDDIFAAYQAAEYMPGDQELASQKLANLYEQEKRTRNKVGDDILNPTYAENMRSLLRKEALDPFYKKAAWNLKIRDEYVPHRQKWMEKWGTSPEAWQDPTGQALASYENAEKSGALKFNPIETVMPFEPQAEVLIKPMLDDVFKNPDRKVKVKKIATPMGTQYAFVDITTGQLKPNFIKEIIQNSELIGGPAYLQMQRRFEATPELVQTYGSFDKYFDNILNNLGKRLAVDYYQEGFQGQLKLPKTTTSEDALEGLLENKVNRGAFKDVVGAVNPIGTPDKEQHDLLNTYYSEIEKELLKDPTKNVYEIAGLEQPIKNEDGTITPNSQGVTFDVAKHEGTGGLSVKMNYTDPATGKPKTVDLLNSPDGIAKAGEFRHLIGNKWEDFISKLSTYSTQVGRAHWVRNNIERMENDAIAHAFDETGSYDPENQDRYQFIKDYYVKNYGQEKWEREIETSPTMRLLKGIASMGVDQTVSFLGKYLNDIKWYDVKDVLGLPEEAFTIPGHGSKSIEAFLRRVKDGNVELPSWAVKDGVLTKEAVTKFMIHDLVKREDENAQEYLDYFKNSWKYGLDQEANILVAGKDKTLADESGIRVAPQRIFYINSPNSSGTGSGKLWAEGYEKLTQDVENLIHGKKRTWIGSLVNFDFTGYTKGGVPLYDNRTNKVVPENERRKIGEIEVVGFKFDEGLTAIIQPKGGGKWYELREEETLLEYLADSNFAPKLMIELTTQASKSFYNEEEDFDGGVLEEGQQRSSYVGKVGMGLYQANIVRYPNDYTDSETGEVIPAGHVRYYNQRNKKWETYEHMDELVQYGYIPDMLYLKNKSGQLYSVDNDSFDVPVQNLDFFMSNGSNKLTPEMIDGINLMADIPGADEKNIFITSMHRGRDHSLSQAYPNSKHIIGDAVDLRVKKGTEIDEDLVDFYYDVHNKLKDQGYHVQLEAKGDLYTKMVNKYGKDFVRFVKHATGPHVHIQYNRPDSDLNKEDFFE